jgi:glycosyltransferase involved in cell wall biosynthesis
MEPTKQYLFKDVSLLVTHYNRSGSLERLLASFRNLHCSFGEIVVSDDGSKKTHLDKIEALQAQYAFKLIKTEKNKGLGNNINKGQDAVTMPLTLYVQEDFEPTPIFPEHFTDACAIFNKEKEWDIMRFYAYFKYPYSKPYGHGFSEMIFHGAPWYTNHLKFYFYSDHPHLRRSNFFEKFGRYPEGISGDKTEYRMGLSFIKHHAKGLFFDEFNTLFYQKNSSDEPSTMQRANWKQKKDPFILMLRSAYLPFKFIKWSLDLLFS